MRLLALVWPGLREPGADMTPFERMLDALDDLSPRVEAVDAGVALVDVTGLTALWGPERRIAARAVMLARSVAPLPVRCGIGDNRWLATLAARLARFERGDAPAAFRALERAELRDLPLALLPADAATHQRLALFGLTTMAQLAGLPRSSVGAQFGAAGERLQDLARGHDPRPIVPRRRPERVEAEAAFETPLDGVGAAGLALRRLAADLCDRLRGRHLAPGRAVLTLRFEDAPDLSVAQPFPQPALEPDWIARLLLSRVEAVARARFSSFGNPVDGSQAIGPSASRESGQISASVGPNEATTRFGAANVTTVAMWQKPPTEPRSTWQKPPPEPRTARQEPPTEPRSAWYEPPPEPRVASVHLAFDRLSDPATRQLPAFEARAGRWEELRWSLERIRHRFGAGRLWRATADRPTAALPEHRSTLVDLGP